MTRTIQGRKLHDITSATRKITSGATTIKASAGILERIIVNDAGQKCIVAIKDGTTTKMLFTLQQNTEGSNPLSYTIPCEFDFTTSLIVEMYRLDPVLFLNFNNPNSTTSEDLSGSNKDGAGGNMEAGDKKEDAERGKYIEMGGTDEFISLGDNFDFGHNTPHSISFWVNKATTNAGYAMAKYSAAAGWGVYYGSDDKLTFFVRDASSGDLTVKYNTALTTNTWTHTIITLDGNGNAAGTSIYINGAVVTTATTSDTLAATSINALNCLLGAKEGPATVWTGLLDEVMIFDRELSASEAEFIYRNGYGYGACDGARLGDITLVYD